MEDRCHVLQQQWMLFGHTPLQTLRLPIWPRMGRKEGVASLSRHFRGAAYSAHRVERLVQESCVDFRVFGRLSQSS